MPKSKRGSRNDPKDYRDIALLSAVSKPKLSLKKIYLTIPMAEEQQRFRQNLSTVIYAIFILRQLVEKVIEYLYLYFIDFVHAFDRLQLPDVINILEKNIDQKIISVIRALNTENVTSIRVNNELTDAIPVPA